eukprot:scaffold240013_cov23-Tisochrysis_lutea.AAC.3
MNQSMWYDISCGMTLDRSSLLWLGVRPKPQILPSFQSFPNIVFFHLKTIELPSLGSCWLASRSSCVTPSINSLARSNVSYKEYLVC